MSSDCYFSVVLPHVALGRSAVCHCGIYDHARLPFCFNPHSLISAFVIRSLEIMIIEQVSEYDQEHCRPTYSTIRKKQRTITAIWVQEDNKSKVAICKISIFLLVFVA